MAAVRLSVLLEWLLRGAWAIKRVGNELADSAKSAMQTRDGTVPCGIVEGSRGNREFPLWRAGYRCLAGCCASNCQCGPQRREERSHDEAHHVIGLGLYVCSCHHNMARGNRHGCGRVACLILLRLVPACIASTQPGPHQTVIPNVAFITGGARQQRCGRSRVKQEHNRKAIMAAYREEGEREGYKGATHCR